VQSFVAWGGRSVEVTPPVLGFTTTLLPPSAPSGLDHAECDEERAERSNRQIVRDMHFRVSRSPVSV